MGKIHKHCVTSPESESMPLSPALLPHLPRLPSLHPCIPAFVDSALENCVLHVETGL